MGTTDNFQGMVTGVPWAYFWAMVMGMKNEVFKVWGFWKFKFIFARDLTYITATFPRNVTGSTKKLIEKYKSLSTLAWMIILRIFSISVCCNEISDL